MAEEERRNERSDEPEGLEEREYTDREGNVHHHTKKYMQQRGREERNEMGEEGPEAEEIE